LVPAYLIALSLNRCQLSFATELFENPISSLKCSLYSKHVPRARAEYDSQAERRDAWRSLAGNPEAREGLCHCEE
jgi:hypothetical protein